VWSPSKKADGRPGGQHRHLCARAIIGRARDAGPEDVDAGCDRRILSVAATSVPSRSRRLGRYRTSRRAGAGSRGWLDDAA
jgi:hypothetical protein